MLGHKYSRTTVASVSITHKTTNIKVTSARLTPSINAAKSSLKLPLIVTMKYLKWSKCSVPGWQKDCVFSRNSLRQSDLLTSEPLNLWVKEVRWFWSSRILRCNHAHTDHIVSGGIFQYSITNFVLLWCLNTCRQNPSPKITLLQMWKDLSLKVETGFGEFVQSVRPFLAWICVFSSLELLINEKVRLHYFWDFWCRENNDRAVSEIRICSIEQLESDSVAKPNPRAWTAARSLSLPSQPGGWLRRV